jgi:AsmA protein
MRKLLVIGILLILIVVMVMLVPFLVDLSAYESQYRPLIEEALNRKVAFKDIRLTIVPQVGVRLRDFTIFDDPAFSGGAFASLSSLDVGVKIWPLLKRRVEVQEIALRDPVIMIIKNAEGVLNTSTLGKKGPAQAGPSAVPPSVEAPLHVLTLLAVDQVSIKDGQLIYKDQSASKPTEYVLQKLKLSLQGVGLGSTAVLRASTTLQPVNLLLTVDGSFGPLQETLDLATFIFNVGIGKSFFEIKGNAIGGNVRMAVSSPSVSTADLPVALPLTKPVELRNLHVAAEGNASRIHFGSVDFMVPLGKNALTVKGNSVGEQTSLKLTALAVNTADLPFALPLKKPIEATDVQGTAELDSSRIRLQNLSFNLFGGSTTTSGLLTMQGHPPPFEGRLSLQGVQLGPVFEALGSDKVAISGAAAAQFVLQGRGFSVPDLTNALEGTGQLAVKEGKIEGINLLKEAAALLRAAGIRQDLANATVFSLIDMKLATRRGIITVERLLMDSHDFQTIGAGTIGFDKSMKMRVSLNLSEALSRSIVSASPIAKLTMTKGRIAVPMIITGTTDAPVYSLDAETVGVKAQEQVKEKLGELLKEKGGGRGTIEKGEETLKKLFGQ